MHFYYCSVYLQNVTNCVSGHNVLMRRYPKITQVVYVDYLPYLQALEALTLKIMSYLLLGSLFLLWCRIKVRGKLSIAKMKVMKIFLISHQREKVFCSARETVRRLNHPPYSCPAKFGYVLLYFRFLFGKKLFSMQDWLVNNKHTFSNITSLPQ